jgi:hypothetical protein
MSEEYSKEELWKLYETLPKELKDAIFSEETANSIYEACTRNNLEEEKTPEIAKYTGYVLMGLLLPSEFEKTLKEKVGLRNDLAKKVNQEIGRFVFFPLRSALEMIYKIEIEPFAKPKPSEKPSLEDLPREKPKKDIYREPLE